jgi:arabinogalactan oligomer/maltooligosaccharide transport system substrate-binding protein
MLAACGTSGSGGGEGSSAPATTSTAASPSGGTASLVIWATPDLAPAIEQVAAQQAQASGTSVLVEAKSLVDIRDDLPVLAPQGQGPDLLVGQSDWVGGFVDDGLLAPVDVDAQSASFRPISLSAFTYGQKVYGVPFGTENLALFRNTGLAPMPPESIEDMAESGLALAEKDKVDVPIALPIGPNGDAYHWYPLYSASGGYLFGQDSDGSYTTDSLGIGEAGSIRAAKDLAELADQDAIDPDLTAGDATDMFTAGRAAYLVAGPWAVAPVREAGVEFVVEKIPGFASTTRPLSQSLVTAHGLLLSAFARNAQAAREFLTGTVMTTQTMDALFAAGGQVPAWAESYDAAADDPIISGFGTVADASVPIPNLSVMDAVWPALSSAEVQVVGGAPAARTMRAAGAEVQAAIDAQ